MQRLGMVVLMVLAVGCGKGGKSTSGSTGGSPQKVNMAKGSGLLPGGTLKDLTLAGAQVNVNIQNIKLDSTYLTYLCDVRSFTANPTLQSLSASVGFDFQDATQVNCAMAVPDGEKIIVSNAQQANISLVASATSIDITTTAQANVTLAVQTGAQYSFNVTGLQVSGLSTCAPYTTTAPGAPSIVVHAGLQANVVCADISQAGWLNPELTDPDTIAAKALNGSLF